MSFLKLMNTRKQTKEIAKYQRFLKRDKKLRFKVTALSKGREILMRLKTQLKKESGEAIIEAISTTNQNIISVLTQTISINTLRIQDHKNVIHWIKALSDIQKLKLSLSVVER